ncbi:hypothetical protein E0K83_11410 [Gramella sp. BOM4]|nr:hypothetical protein [Christiangramia bathymodioli]
MKLRIPRLDLEQQLLKIRNKTTTQEALLEEVQRIFQKTDQRDEEILDNIQNGTPINFNDFDPDLLERDRIFHIDQIYSICVDYRLRFLDSKFFKAEIPYEALIKIKEEEKLHGTQLKGFKIVAPATLFKLENADDPLLFAPIGNDYYYLLHKWGKDLHPLRKLMMWPFKTLENFILLLLLVSFVTALLVPEGLFTKNQSTTEFFMIFFFIFKWFAGLAIFYGFKMGKNFSTDIWNSKFYNA